MRCSRPSGREHGQTFASDAAPSPEQEEEELAPVLLGAPEDNFAVNIVDLALMAAQNEERYLDWTFWNLINGNFKTAVKVNHNVDKLETLGDHFVLEDRLEAKSDAHATDLLERAKAHLERMATNTNPAKATVDADKRELIHKRKHAPSAGANAWAQSDYARLLEVSALQEPNRLTQRCLCADSGGCGRSAAC